MLAHACINESSEQHPSLFPTIAKPCRLHYYLSPQVELRMSSKLRSAFFRLKCLERFNGFSCSVWNNQPIVKSRIKKHYILIISNYWMTLSRIWRILQVEESVQYPPRPSASVDNTLRDLQNSSYPTKAEFNNCFIIHSKYDLRSNL